MKVLKRFPAMMAGREELQETIGEFMQIDRLHRRVFDRLVDLSGLPHGQFRMLAYLTRADGAQSQKTLADHFQISSAAVTTMLQKLEAAGLVERCSVESDNRLKTIRVTARGRAAVDRTGQEFVRTDVAMLDGFSEEELTILRGYLSRMRENLNALQNDVSDIDEEEWNK